MFAEYFDAAEKHLRSIGKIPSICIGRPVSEERLDQVTNIIGRPIPVELRAYLREMGDGYRFSPSEEQEGFQIGWLGDYRYKVAGFVDVLREEAEQRRVHPPEIVAQELKRREQWFPFYNFGGGGHMFCLDLNNVPSPVRNYECVYWPNDPVETWSFQLADSLVDFVRQWSRFCFADAKGATLINVAMGASGRFDWEPSRFESIFDRGTTDG